MDPDDYDVTFDVETVGTVDNDWPILLVKKSVRRPDGPGRVVIETTTRIYHPPRVHAAWCILGHWHPGDCQTKEEAEAEMPGPGYDAQTRHA